MSAPLFPGGVAVSDLVVYDGQASDGCRGGSPHVHTASSEGYVVVSGSGSVQTLSAEGAEEHDLAPGDVLWFSPGTVHRLVNGGDLRLVVVMSNAGLPEAGDAVMTFPSAILDDPVAYARAATLPAVAPGDEIAAAAMARRDLAVAGYRELRAAVAARGADALAEFHERALRLVQPRVAAWTALWESTVAAETDRTRAGLEALAAGRTDALGAASVVRAEVTSGERGYGMCGRLRTWRWPSGTADRTENPA